MHRGVNMGIVIGDTTLRIKKSTKSNLHSLDFIKKDSDNTIIECLIDIYKTCSENKKDDIKRIIAIRRKRTEELKQKLSKRNRNVGRWKY